MDRGAWWATVNRVVKSQTRLKRISMHTCDYIMRHIKQVYIWVFLSVCIYKCIYTCVYACVYTLVQFSCSVVSNSLWPHESQHTRPPCPSPTPRVHSHSRPSSQWCHPAISSSVVPFSSCPQSLPASVFQWVSSSHEVVKVLEFQL